MKGLLTTFTAVTQAVTAPTSAGWRWSALRPGKPLKIGAHRRWLAPGRGLISVRSVVATRALFVGLDISVGGSDAAKEEDDEEG